jgi:hypothetical protein
MEGFLSASSEAGRDCPWYPNLERRNTVATPLPLAVVGGRLTRFAIQVQRIEFQTSNATFECLKIGGRAADTSPGGGATAQGLWRLLIDILDADNSIRK